MTAAAAGTDDAATWRLVDDEPALTDLVTMALRYEEQAKPAILVVDISV